MSKRFDLLSGAFVIERMLRSPTTIRVVSGTVKVEATYCTQEEVDAGTAADWETLGSNLVGPVTSTVANPATALRYTAVGSAVVMYQVH